MAIKDTSQECTKCPLSDNYFNRGAMVVRLEHDGNISEAAGAIVGNVTSFIPTVTRRMTKYLESASIVLLDCADGEEARKTLREKFLKLPEDYLTILDRLADHLWEKTYPEQGSGT